jgi:hypothetical protein
MSANMERMREKRSELIEIALSVLLGQVDGNNLPDEHALSVSAERLVDSFATLTPPEEEEQQWHMVIMETWRGGATSAKPGNLLLSFGELITSAAAVTLYVPSAVKMPWTIPFAALVIWGKIWSQVKVSLTPMDAAVIWTMWKSRDDKNVSPGGQELLVLVNKELRDNGYPELSPQMLDDHLETLRRIGCVKHSSPDYSKWWMCEWVRVKYR